MKLAPLVRSAEVTDQTVDADKRTIEISFSSETPVSRWFGTEILDHDKKSANLDRLNSGTAPVLFNHNVDDLRGVVEKAWVGKDRRGYAVIRIAKGEAGDRALEQINDRVLRNVSFMYRVNEWEQTSKEAEASVYRITDWEALEISLVTIPADPSVGIGRSLQRGFDMAEKEVKGPKGNESTETRVEPGADREQLGAMDKRRIDAIREFSGQFKLPEKRVQAWIDDGTPLEEVMRETAAMQRAREKERPSAATYLDMGKDAKRYSLMKAIRAVINKNWTDAGLELESSKLISERTRKLPRSENAFFIPLDVMLRDLPPSRMQRDMTVAGVSGSNYLVGTENRPGNFIDLLRNTSVAVRMGVEVLPGLVGNVTIPKMTAGNTAYWLADETTQITESQPTLGQLALSPKNVAALTELSHQLIQQSTPAAEGLVMTSIARDIGLAVDVGVLRGSGASGQPTGIATTGSIGAFTGTSLAAAGCLNAIADVGAANALFPGCGFATTHTVASLLMDRPNVTGATDGTPLWQGRMEEGTIRGYPAMASGQMSAGTALFGWWPSVVLAEWGMLELMVNPFSDFTRGLSAVRGWYTCDVGVRYAGAWSYATSIT